MVTNCDHLARLKFSRTLPFAFTEHGAIMAANVLNTHRAINVSVYVVRAFVKLRELLSSHKELAGKLAELERKVGSHDVAIQSLVTAIRQLMQQPPSPPRSRIGFHVKPEAEATANCWRQIQKQHPIFIEKVSFVPDHVHLAVQIHPSFSPAAAVVALMNAAQELMWKDFEDSVVRSRAQRLWQPGAYVGSYGSWNRPKSQPMFASGKRPTRNICCMEPRDHLASLSSVPNDPSGKPKGLQRLLWAV